MGFSFDISDYRFKISIGFRFHLIPLSMISLYLKTISYLLAESTTFLSDATIQDVGCSNKFSKLFVKFIVVQGVEKGLFS